MPNLKLVLILVLNAMVLISALWLKPRYQTNDDIAMIYAYSGTNIFDQPTAVTAFSTKIWGLLMVFLYQVAPKGIEVYTVVFLILIFALSVIIHNKLLENINIGSSFFWIILIPVLTFITLNFYLELQFTMVSGLLCFSGILLLLRQPSNLEMISGIASFILAAMLRLDVIPVVLAFLFILCLFLTFYLPALIDSRQRILKRFGLLVLVFISVKSLDRSIHTQAEKQFLEFNNFRSVIVDYNADVSNPSMLPDHWGREELYLFKNWFYSDDMLYNSARNYEIANSSHKLGLMEKARSNLKNISINLRQLGNPYFLCVLILAMIPLFFLKEWKKGLVFMFVGVLVYLIFYSLLSVFFKEPPFRVSFMLFSSGILLYLYFITKMEAFVIPEVRILFAVVCLGIPMRLTMKNLSQRKEGIIEGSCDENYKKDLIYIHSPFYPFELVDPFEVSVAGQVRKVWLCSFSAHPVVKRTLRDFKFNNLTSDIIGKEEMVSFIMPVDSERWLDFKNAYTVFMARQYGKNVFFERDYNGKHCFGFAEYKLKERI